MVRTRFALATFIPLLALALTLAGCGSGDAGNPRNIAASGQSLTAAEVDLILVRAVSQATAVGTPIAVAVCDREGEVLGVYVMAGRDVLGDGTIDSPGAANVNVAISKAATAAAFESEQEAFTSRTAFFIVQGHFPPGVAFTPGGPLFGVQDSGLVSSDVRSAAYDQAGNAVGAGISGELGGVPLYKNGAPVGAVGVDSVDVERVRSGALTLVTPVQNSVDEAIAIAAAAEFPTPAPIQATNATVDGISLPFEEAFPGTLAPLLATSTAALSPSVGAIAAQFPVRASPLPAEVRQSGQFGIRAARRYAGRLVARAGGPFQDIDRDPGVVLDPTSGAFLDVPTVAAEIRTIAGVPGEVRIPIIDGVEPPPAEGGLSGADINTIIEQAVAEADAISAGIRLPRGVGARMHIVVVDVRGNLLGGFRMGDGTLFSFDIAAQKARTCAFFSSDTLAVSARGFGFLAQPYFPPGIQGTEPGPLARLRDLVNRGLVTIEDPPSFTTINPSPDAPSDGRADRNLLLPGVQASDDFAGFVTPSAAVVDDFRARLSSSGGVSPLRDRPASATIAAFVSPGLENGLQTFPGAVPLYKSGKMVGAIGVSGDGVDQDDLVSAAGAAGFEPPPAARIDQAGEAAIATGFLAKMDVLVAAMAAHPDPDVRAIYGPVFARERERMADRFSRGLAGVRIPYVKFPRNPTEGRTR